MAKSGSILKKPAGFFGIWGIRCTLHQHFDDGPSTHVTPIGIFASSTLGSDLVQTGFDWVCHCVSNQENIVWQRLGSCDVTQDVTQCSLHDEFESVSGKTSCLTLVGEEEPVTILGPLELVS